MAVFLSGKVLSQLRRRKNISLDKLCNGICDRTTLIRIEKGERVPSNHVFRLLFQRLGQDPDKFYVYATNINDLEFENEYQRIEDLFIARKIEEARVLFNFYEDKYMKSIEKDNHKFKMQKVLSLKASLWHTEEISSNNCLELILNAIKITTPDFNIDIIKDTLFSTIEISLICKLSSTYFKLGETDISLKILYDIKSVMDGFYNDVIDIASSYTTVMFQLSSQLGLLGCYSEALSVAEAGISYAISGRDLFYLPELTFNKACSLYYMNPKGKKEYTQLLISAYYGLVMKKNNWDAKVVKDFSAKEIGFDIP